MAARFPTMPNRPVRHAVWTQDFWRRLSVPGLLLGALLLAASLTPSLIPRAPVPQGVLAGVCFAIGYGLGVLGDDLWTWLGLRRGSDRLQQSSARAALAVAVVVVTAFSWQSAAWQNSIRELMGIEAVPNSSPWIVLGIAVAVFVLAVLLMRGVTRLYYWSESLSGRVMPVRLARLVAAAAAMILLVLLVNGVLLRGVFQLADRSFGALDARIESDLAPPADPMATGSATSLVPWQDLGRTGRDFIAAGPTAADISGLTGRPALQPIRVYVGLNGARTPEERAALALAELIRVGGFDRKVLIVTVPTGTGWMDPSATDPIEYLHDGDTANVAVQYSYFSSPLSLLFESGFASETGRALFREVYGHWTALPKDKRPKLYLFGLSLGSSGSEQSFSLHEVFPDPFDGALWAGPPFSNPIWRSATRDREAGSPEWLPVFGDSSMIRFSSQENQAAMPGVPWGPMRIVYLQYASDPITFFSAASFWRRPDWMQAPRGPDVSPELRWYPVVTGLQLALDMAIGLAVPPGFGHDYAPAHYIDAWIAVTAPEGWSPEDVARLKERLLR
ncbi:alpha/beta-hydrolase family protein [Paracoccus methylovorus]|uniref:Alpha/beta-hydrolase family protein n=1 Tax=Paracoccus methylovorus TaxID=2812658 RepID=A0ABX7JN75_9RHOB|nr:alpha/beta-hydrolase family protein [Paracoccus methylovorus]QRZ15119.1 alpha/beta-hydrolase family protein [Paracoccus methylovorus]